LDFNLWELGENREFLGILCRKGSYANPSSGKISFYELAYKTGK